MKDNQHEQLFTELRAEYEAPAFTELDDETGAAIGGGEVVLYDAVNLDDRHYRTFTSNTNTPYVGDRFNDKTSSILITSGTWRFYDGANYTGFHKDLKPGRYPWVQNVGITNDTISSFKKIA